jgi:AcrR family transcriptional regulator
MHAPSHSPAPATARTAPTAEPGPPPSTRPPASTGSARRRLLEAVIDHFATDGLADQSLRHIAQEVGTSHRMLLYHFGSKDGLLLEVVRAVEARTQAYFAAVGAEAGSATDELVRRVWAYVADPALADFERLFFALYGRALQGDAAALPLLTDDLERWVDANAAQAAAVGIPPETARVHARLGLAVTRGLLLDLLATGEREGVEAALQAFAARYAGRWWEEDPPVGGQESGSGGPSDTTDRAS